MNDLPTPTTPQEITRNAMVLHIDSGARFYWQRLSASSGNCLMAYIDGEGRPRLMNINPQLSKLFKLRLRKNGALTFPGAGYSRADLISEHLANLPTRRKTWVRKLD